MNKIILLLCCALFWAASRPLPAQEVLAVGHSCNFAAADAPAEVYTYEASQEAIQIVERIMQMNVLPQNFVVRSADCNNALATTIGKRRYILYSTAFLENFKKEANTAWAAYSVLAHEIGHHLSNHDLEQTNPRVRKQYELEADKFSGGILYRLGATLEEAQAGINTFSLDSDSPTHPPKRARLEALAVGWKQAEELAAAAETSVGAAAADSDEKKLYIRALAEKDPYQAIEWLDEAIEIKEDYADAYLERGKRKVDIENVDDIRVRYQDAIEDYNTYIQMRPKDPVAYAERGYAYRKLDQDDQALKDYNQAIRLDAKYAEAYLGRAWVKFKKHDEEGALKDLEKATQIKPDYADAHYAQGDFHYFAGEYTKAIVCFDKALQADSVYLRALNLRAGAKQFSGLFAEAVQDYDRLQALDTEAFSAFLDRGKCYQALGKHREAIADFNTLAEKIPGAADTYIYRGVSQYVLGHQEAAEADFKKVFENTVLVVNSSVKIGCLLVEHGLAKEGLVWLDQVLAKSPDNRRAQECKERADKK